MGGSVICDAVADWYLLSKLSCVGAINKSTKESRMNPSSDKPLPSLAELFGALWESYEGNTSSLEHLGHFVRLHHKEIAAAFAQP